MTAHSRPHASDEADAAVLAGAVGFMATLFRGRGVYERVPADSLAEAMDAGRRLERQHPNGKRALIYAIDGDGRSALVTPATMKAAEGTAMKSYSKRFNAQRAAKAAGLDPAETEIIRTAEGFAFRQKPRPQPEPAPEAPKPQRAAKGGRKAELEAAARRGQLPPVPDFSAATHARYRGKLARLVELAEAGDIAGLKAVEINPVSTSPKAMARYRDLAVIALEARAS